MKALLSWCQSFLGLKTGGIKFSRSPSEFMRCNLQHIKRRASNLVESTPHPANSGLIDLMLTAP
jgi:hypothetical protein